MTRVDNPLYEERFGRLALPIKDAAQWLGIHPRTLWAQETGRNPIFLPILRALQLRGGDLGQHHDGWQGWRIGPDGLLYAPGYRDGWAPGQIMADLYRSQLLAEYARQVREFNGMETQPETVEMPKVIKLNREVK